MFNVKTNLKKACYLNILFRSAEFTNRKENQTYASPFPSKLYDQGQQRSSLDCESKKDKDMIT